jgi:hypothetical protein
MAAAKEALPQLGFRHRRGEFVLDLATGVVGLMGFNTGNVAPGTIIVAPIIAVRHDHIQREIVHRTGSGSAETATIAAHLWDMGPVEDVPELRVFDTESAAYVVELVCSQLRDYGIRWMWKLVDLRALVTALRRWTRPLPEYSLPLILRDLGEIKAALDVIDEWETRLRSPVSCGNGGGSSVDEEAIDEFEREFNATRHERPEVVRFDRFAKQLRRELAASG